MFTPFGMEMPENKDTLATEIEGLRANVEVLQAKSSLTPEERDLKDSLLTRLRSLETLNQIKEVRSRPVIPGL